MHGPLRKDRHALHIDVNKLVPKYLYDLIAPALANLQVLYTKENICILLQTIVFFLSQGRPYLLFPVFLLLIVLGGYLGILSAGYVY